DYSDLNIDIDLVISGNYLVYFYFTTPQLHIKQTEVASNFSNSDYIAPGDASSVTGCTNYYVFIGTTIVNFTENSNSWVLYSITDSTDPDNSNPDKIIAFNTSNGYYGPYDEDNNYTTNCGRLTWTVQSNTTKLVKDTNPTTSISGTNNNYLKINVSAGENVIIDLKVYVRVIICNEGVDNNVTVSVIGGSDKNSITTFSKTGDGKITSYIDPTNAYIEAVNTGSAVYFSSILYGSTSDSSSFDRSYTLHSNSVIKLEYKVNITLSSEYANKTIYETDTSTGESAIGTSIEFPLYIWGQFYNTSSAMLIKTIGAVNSKTLTIKTTYVGNSAANVNGNLSLNIGSEYLPAGESTYQNITGQSGTTTKDYTFNVINGTIPTINLKTADGSSDLQVHDWFLNTNAKYQSYEVNITPFRFVWSTSSITDLTDPSNYGTTYTLASQITTDTTIYLYLIKRYENTIDLYEDSVFISNYYSPLFNNAGTLRNPTFTAQILNSVVEDTFDLSFESFNPIYTDGTVSGFTTINKLILSYEYSSFTYEGTTFDMNDMYNTPTSIGSYTIEQNLLYISPMITLKTTTATVQLNELQSSILNGIEPNVRFGYKNGSYYTLTTTEGATGTDNYYKMPDQDFPAKSKLTLYISETSNIIAQITFGNQITMAYGTYLDTFRSDEYNDPESRILASISHPEGFKDYGYKDGE
ncbi:MAG: hypothetical protein ACI4PF_04605, partial [Christensenellales bacterium]